MQILSNIEKLFLRSFLLWLFFLKTWKNDYNPSGACPFTGDKDIAFPIFVINFQDGQLRRVM
jgi:hypothetical protein